MLERVRFWSLLILACLALPAAAQSLDLQYERSVGKHITRAPGTTNYPSGVAVNPNNGDIYAMDLLFNRVQRFSATGDPLAQWNCRQGLGLDVDPRDNSVWVAMWTRNQVIKYSDTGEVLVTLGTGRRGTGDGEFDRPHDVSVDPRNGDVYVIDTFNKRVQVFNTEGRFLRKWDYPFVQPFGIGVHPGGDFLVVANTVNRELIKFDLQGKVLANWVRGGSAKGQFRWPRDVVVDAEGFIYEADTDNERIQKLDSDGNFVAFFQGPNDRWHGSFHPRSVDVNVSNGQVLAAAAYSNRIDVFQPDGTFIRSVGKRDREGDHFNTPKAIGVDPNTGDVYVGDWMDHRIRHFDASGAFVASLDSWIPEQTDLQGQPFPQDFATNPETAMWIAKEDQAFPGAIAVDGEGNYWMLRGSMHYDDDPRQQADWLVRRFTPKGEFISGFGNVEFPRNARMRGLAIDRRAHAVYVSNTAANKLMKFDFTGRLLWAVGGKGQGDGQLRSPVGVAVDSASGLVFVLDSANQRVQCFGTDGAFVRAWGTAGDGDGQFAFTDFSGIGVDARGYVFVGDTANHRLQVFDFQGKHLLSYGQHGFGGHGRYNGLSGVSAASGKLYLVDVAGGEVEVYDISSWPDNGSAQAAAADPRGAPAPAAPESASTIPVIAQTPTTPAASPEAEQVDPLEALQNENAQLKAQIEELRERCGRRCTR